jgi:hypothetical protein
MEIVGLDKTATRRTMFAFSRNLHSKNSTAGGEGLICYLFKDDISAVKRIHVYETSDK